MVASNPLDDRHRSRIQRLRFAAVMGVLVIAAFGVALWLHPAEIRKHDIQSPASASATCIGVERCAGCHVAETEAWRQSHHAQAMQQANASTVLGNFRNARFAKDGSISSFYLKDEKHYVRTDGPTASLMIILSPTHSASSRYSSISCHFRTAIFRVLLSPGIHEVSSKAVSSGFISIQTKKCLTPIRSTGREETRPGTTCVPSVTRRICARITISIKTATPRRGRKSTFRANPATDLVQTT